jgi:hypothetical protein
VQSKILLLIPLLDCVQAAAQFMRAPDKWNYINTVTELGQ